MATEEPPDFVIEDNIIKCLDYAEEPDPRGVGYELLEAMKYFKDRVAQYVVETGEADTYEAFSQRCIRTALKMKSMGTTEDHVICVCSQNHKNASVPFIASILIGAKPIGLPPKLTTKEAEYMLELVNPKMIFVDASAAEMLRDTLRKKHLPVVGFDEHTEWTCFQSFLEPHPEENNFLPYYPRNLQETVMILFTSGTTSMPKALCLNHYTVLQKIPPAKRTTITEKENCFGKRSQIFVFLSHSNLCWISAVQLLLSSVLCGYTRVTTQFEVSNFWKIVEDFKVSMAFLSPPELVELLKNKKPNGVDISSLKAIVTGGIQVLEELLTAVREMFVGVTVLQNYGSTEVCGILTGFDTRKTRDREVLMTKPKSCGLPIRGIWYKVVDHETKKLLGPNEKGELLIKSKAVAKKYYNSDESTLDSEGWLATGDLVSYDTDGSIYVVDRIKDLVVYNFYPIATVTIENVVRQHPSVEAVAVVGVPGVESDLITAVVVLKDGCSSTTAEDIRTFVDDRVDDPRKLRGGVKFIKQFPLTPTQKVKKHILREMIESREL